jgi:hypothetical protein
VLIAVATRWKRDSCPTGKPLVIFLVEDERFTIHDSTLLSSCIKGGLHLGKNRGHRRRRIGGITDGAADHQIIGA